MRFILWFLALFFILSFLSGPRAFSEETDTPWRIKADKLDFNRDTQVYNALGNVIIIREKEEINAHAVEYNMLTNNVEATGNVFVSMGDDWIKGESANINLEDKTGRIKDANLFITENNVYVKAENIEKLQGDTYIFNDAWITTCDGELPDWSFAVTKGRVTIDGYAQGINARFLVKGFPVFYAPYLIYPVKTKRQTGFLIPYPGYSKEYGPTLDIPFFYVLSQSMDATFYSNFEGKRGFMPGIEYRYKFSSPSQGILRADYLKDQVDEDDVDKLDEQDPYRDKERYWIRGKITQSMPLSFTSYIDMDIMSDRDYLQEFDTRYTGYDWNNSTFKRLTGREILNGTDDYIRENRVSLWRRWESYYLSIHGIYNQNLDRAIDENQLQKFPEILFQASGRRLLDPFPLYGNIDSSYVNYYRGAGTHGHRIDIYPGLSLPFNIGPFSFLPSAHIRETLYSITAWEDNNGDKIDGDDFEARHLYDIGMDLTTDIYNVTHFDNNRFTALKHTIRPEFRFNYIPTVDQSSLPSWDEIDYFKRDCSITYGFRNIFTARIEDEKREKPGYRDFLTTNIYQLFDFHKEELDSDNKERSFSDIHFELELSPYSDMRLNYDISYNPYDGRERTHNLKLFLKDFRDDRLTLDYRFTRDNTKELNSSLNLTLFMGFTFTFKNKYNFILKKSLETEYGLNYSSQCWGVSTSYRIQPDDHNIMVLFSLYGLGDLGGDL